MKNKIILLLSLLVFATLVITAYTSKSTQQAELSTQVAQVVESTIEEQIAGSTIEEQVIESTIEEQVAEPTQTIRLKIYKGWNLVSLGLIENAANICPPKSLIVLYGYDPLENRYIKIKDVTEVSSHSEMLRSIKEFYTGSNLTRSPVNSGWLYSSADCEIIREMSWGSDFMQEDILEQIRSLGVKFPAGWNFFTVLLEMIGKSIDEVKGDCLIEKAYIWNPEDQTWIKLWEQKLPETLMGLGIVFKTTNDCQLGEIITIPGAPALPE